VIQVPSPTIGVSSRVEGMGRRAGEPSWARSEIGRSVAAAVAASEACTNVRRVVRIRCSITAAGKPPARKAQSNGTPPPALQYKLQIKARDQICSRAPCSIYDGPLTLLDELQSSQTCVTALADDDMVVEEMPTGLARSTIAFVIWISACGAVGSPEGRLCSERLCQLAG
jgi:hypothetical protein